MWVRFPPGAFFLKRFFRKERDRPLGRARLHLPLNPEKTRPVLEEDGRLRNVGFEKRDRSLTGVQTSSDGGFAATIALRECLVSVITTCCGYPQSVHKMGKTGHA